MKIGKFQNPGACCSQEPMRYGIMHGWLDVELRSLIVTDGKVLARIPVEVSTGDVSGFVNPEALAYARDKGVPLFCSKDSLTAGTEGPSWPRRGDAEKFPNWKEVLPDFKGKKTASIAFNPTFLGNLCKAVDGHSSCRLEFALDDKGNALPEQIRVTFQERTKGRIDGDFIIMPIVLEP